MNTLSCPGNNVLRLPLAPEARHGVERFAQLYGSSPPMREMYSLIERVAPSDATVLIIGESGSGKELVAQSVHQYSGRAEAPFLAVNCGAIPPSLIEAELFGHEKGAFTGALHSHQGLFERAAGGSLFLDEITEMAPEMQVRLLRVLESGKFFRVGGDKEIPTDVRIIAATNRPPTQAVEDGHLREDLLYRLAVFPIEVPPLRHRGEDVTLLAQHFLDELNAAEEDAKVFSPTALTALQSETWPGNVRELKNRMQRAFILADGMITAEHLGPVECETGSDEADASALNICIGSSLMEIEKLAICATLDHCGGNKRRAAQMLGVSVKTLYNRLADYTKSATTNAHV
jgi:DNA-binding NtrC family response regulator